MTDYSIGIDLSINGAHDCTILDATGQLVQRFTFDSSFAGLQKLEQHLCGTDPSHGASVVVMEPTALAWFLPCLYLRARHPQVKVVRIKTSKVAALRRYLKRDAKSDHLDALTLAKMPLVDPEGGMSHLDDGWNDELVLAQKCPHPAHPKDGPRVGSFNPTSLGWDSGKDLTGLR